MAHGNSLQMRDYGVVWEICLGTHLLALLWVPSRCQGLSHKMENLNSHEVGGTHSKLPIEKYNPHYIWFSVGAFIGRGKFPPLVSRNLRHGFIFVIIKHVQ